MVLAGTFAAPVLGIVVAGRPQVSLRLRRLAYASVLAPTLYVFLGVVQALIGSPVPDPWVWCVLWSVALVWALRDGSGLVVPAVPAGLGRWRVAHGISAALLCLYVLFHLANHLTGLLGTERYAAVMDAGRLVYRAAWVEPLLVAAVLF
ncbi:MAG: hypothetical protein GAK31_01833 [Stenotrophomonas maltophilia]|uniref:Uncharacterized protein n=1 Tax=Stenotrophomonas maltophilia TaxID=40324 RepID=A0A7V8FIF2_STEMA|nr:MAG: hypothetical protein GAK31_01833 [Stenotrophomonas maltophilia]